MENKKLILKLGFFPKNNENNVFYKKYKNHNYLIEIDFEKEAFGFGKGIKAESKTTQNFSQAENWVVLECVDRLLEKGYKPTDITLEKTWKLGHQGSGRLDILVEKNEKSFLMIECKTWGSEFEKELQKMQKDGGQLFSYFQQDTKTEQLILYASRFHNGEIEYRNDIIKIENSYRETGNVTDLYERWNKFTKTSGVFEDWVKAYEFKSKALTLKDLNDIKQEDSSFIFNRFLEILRHNVVSDKPNAFNKIFTLFLCKIKDEDKNPSEELEFQWKEGEDNNISFQKRLTDLYKNGMKEFLEKEVTDFSDKDFNEQFGGLDLKTREKILEQFTKIRLQKNNEFAIKEVFDEETFNDNGKVLKEVVELLQKFKFRYNKKQPFLGDFFELLLTTGLKQESGQFFTPVPIARFICKSVPLKETIERKLSTGTKDELLPNVIDYAAGSGHFLTESMEEIQNIVEELNTNKYSPKTTRQLDSWKVNPFDWAYEYIFGIELDYRLVKTSKVGCYLHGDGIANVIHGDGLANFASKDYRGKLKNEKGESENPRFDFVLSNPPYSVSAFKGHIKSDKPAKDFELYSNLTERSSEIECLFIERTKQLLAEGGVAAIILPSSILSNTGIYAKTREILFKYFEFVAITELGSGTFMATGTNTVVLFLRRRNNFDWQNIKTAVDNFFHDFQEKTIAGIENPITKYIKHTFEDISRDDYVSMFAKNPTATMGKNELYQEYIKKLKYKNTDELSQKIAGIEAEKLYYFLLAYSQKPVVVKTGQKSAEKKFLGYEFSNRKGSEGIHPIKRGKTIDDCTSLFDSKNPRNFAKASSYILEAFNGESETKIQEDLQKNISRVNLVDMMNFDRVDFEKNINLNLKKKIKIESKWDLKKLGDIAIFLPKSKRSAGSGLDKGKYPFFTSSQIQSKWINEADFTEEAIIVGDGGNSSIFISNNFSVSDHNFVFFVPDIKTENKYIYLFLSINFNLLTDGLTGSGLQNISKSYLCDLKIPLPPLNIQQKIVAEIEV